MYEVYYEVRYYDRMKNIMKVGYYDGGYYEGRRRLNV